jgi:hypothetical protein
MARGIMRKAQGNVLLHYLTLAYDPDASLQGYTWKKLYIEHGDVFFYLMPYK